MLIGARNQLKGTVVAIEKGAINGIVTIELPSGDRIDANLSVGSIEKLGLEVGKEAYAIFKAMDVIVGVDHN